MKNLHRSLLFGLMMTTAFVPLLAQDPITTIDGIFIQRGSPNSPETTDHQLNSTPIVDGDVIVFDIPGIGDFLGDNPENINDVVLVVENIPLPEMPAFIEDAESSLVKFRFQDHQLTAEHRQQIYDYGEVENKELQLGVKIGKNIALNYSPKANFLFEKVKSWRTVRWIFIGVFAVLFTILVLLFPDMIKNEVANPLQGGPPLKGAYSFGRSQLAYWSLIIFSSFIYIYLFTDDINSMNTTALVLLGISAATVGASSILGKPSQKDKDAVSLLSYESTRRNFFKDILSDSSGLSINRFQAFTLNVIFGFVFLKTVFADYAMPTFDETQLLLLGISNGTYVFLKIDENKERKPEPQQP